MSLAMLLLAAWLILVAISQYFMAWVRFGEFGLIVIGMIGFAAGILLVLEGFSVWTRKIDKP